jgi:hypothetical protein
MNMHRILLGRDRRAHRYQMTMKRLATWWQLILVTMIVSSAQMTSPSNMNESSAHVTEEADPPVFEAHKSLLPDTPPSFQTISGYDVGGYVV